MSLAHYRQRTLASSDHVARYCRRRDIANGIVARTAFLLRPNERYLSTNRLEHFHDSDRQFQIAGVRQALTDKGFQVRPTAYFAALNVGVAVAVCKNALNLDIQILTLGESQDPSHTGIYGYSPEDTAAAAVLARSVSTNEVYPATT